MSIKLITEDILIKVVAERWFSQYKDTLDDEMFMGKGTAREIHTKLLALKDDATAGNVRDIIGNDSWTHIGECSNCGRGDNKYLVCLGVEEICGDCIKEIIGISEGLDI